MIIYKITNTINDKIYIGKDSKNDPNYFGSGVLIKKSIKKYGKENFKKEILEECKTLEELNNQEIFWINELNSISPNGYNLTNGGTGGDTFSNLPDDKKNEINKKRINTIYSKYGDDFYKRNLSEETKIKIGKAFKGKKVINRKSPPKFTEEHKKNISEANKNRILTEEHKKNISESKKGSSLNNNIKIKISKKLKGNSNAKGYKHTEDAKKRMSEKKIGNKSNKGYKWTEEQKLKLKETRKNKNKNVMTIIYLLECRNDTDILYKIGSTKISVKSRILKLQTGNPFKIEEVSKFESLYGQKVEKMLHKKFRHCKETGEWFKLDRSDVENFNKICEKIEKGFDALKDNPFFK